MSTTNKKQKPWEAIKRLIYLPVNEQMILREELICTLETYLKTCKTPEDLKMLNGESHGLWFGDVRILAMLGACGNRIYNNQE